MSCIESAFAPFIRLRHVVDAIATANGLKLEGFALTPDSDSDRHGCHLVLVESTEPAVDAVSVDALRAIVDAAPTDRATAIPAVEADMKRGGVL